MRFVGRRDRCPAALLRADGPTWSAAPPSNTRLDLWVAFDYGGRDELVRAARALVEDGRRPRPIDEAALRAHLYAPEMPDPDLVIRTSGELRISNFLLWQAAYAELALHARRSGPTSARSELGASAVGLRRRAAGGSACGERPGLARR